ncbi:sensor domain-containing diguanylate cyclase [Ureibacillus sp. FSL K6-8385]|uniref:sensor domain-containing protein n=1 Tax=Ureibacillus TaxID=160795 RepID=UPI002E24980B|nr:sensor domain-containing diguanylate cyclase [Ureibacillus terrenus]MED3764324.1 sensor domain-containing diguanylate cyclase [Ureibacillus terrenus]
MEYRHSVDPNALEIVWNHANEALFIFDYEGNILEANPAFAELFGGKPEDLRISVCCEDSEECEELLDMLKRGEDIPFHFIQRKRKDGKVLDILASYGAVNKGKVLAVGMYKDFTGKMEIHRKLKSSHDGYRKLLDEFPYAVLMIKDETVIYANRAGLEIVGASSKEVLIGKPIWQLIRPEEEQSIRQRLMKGMEVTVHEEIERFDGRKLWVEIAMRRVCYENEYVLQMVLRDVTEKRNYEEQLKFFAYQDPLTGLFNRRYFTKEMKKSVEEARKNNRMFGVMFIDLDDFKKVNDSLGHEMGDQLLIQFADRLKKKLREGDIICRFGGDEFLVLIKNIRGKKALVEVVNRLQDALRRPYQLGEESVVVTSSIGIAMFPHDGTDAKTLLSCADQALYEAKEQGEGFRFFRSRD